MTNTTLFPTGRFTRAAATQPVASGLTVRLILALILTPVLAVGCAVAIFSATDRDWWVLLRDPATAFEFAPYAGLFSHLGVMAMTAAGAIAVFVASQIPAGKPRAVLFYVGVFTLWLALDDLFMLHESLIPRLTGLPELLILGLYVVVAMGLMWLIGASVMSRRYLAFWLSAGFLTLMLVTDVMVKVATSPSFLLEETAKIIGFTLWSAFWIAEARAALQVDACPRP